MIVSYILKCAPTLSCHYTPRTISTRVIRTSRSVAVAPRDVAIATRYHHVDKLPLRSLHCSSSAHQNPDRVGVKERDIETPKVINIKSSGINVSQIMRNIQSNVKLKPDDGTYKGTDQFEYWIERKIHVRQLHKIYLALSKSRLTTLVVFTAIAGYAFAPSHATMTTFSALTFGTFLCSGAANAFNQVMEAPYDSQMDRCKQRVLVRQLITPLHATCFGVTSAVLGTGLLYHFANPLTAALGFSNIILYSLVYTTMKRYTTANTWIGSIVGAIPPAMGWAAATGSLDWGALALCALLYFWQFPHFNSLSYNIKQDYCRAGYHMMSVYNAKYNALVSLRNTTALLPLCVILPFTGISHCSFSFYSLLINTYFIYLAWNFYKAQNKQTARDLFRFSLVYLPILFGSLAIGYAFKKRTSQDNKHHKSSNSQMASYVRDLCPFLPPTKEN